MTNEKDYLGNIMHFGLKLPIKPEKLWVKAIWKLAISKSESLSF